MDRWDLVTPDEEDGRGDEQDGQGVFESRYIVYRLDMGDVEEEEQSGDQTPLAVAAELGAGQGQNEAGQDVAGDGEQVEVFRVVTPGGIGAPHDQFIEYSAGCAGFVLGKKEGGVLAQMWIVESDLSVVCIEGEFSEPTERDGGQYAEDRCVRQYGVGLAG